MAKATLAAVAPVVRLGVKVFAPDVFLNQAVALVVMIALRGVFWWCRKLLRRGARDIWAKFSEEARVAAGLRAKRRECADYASFRRLGEQLDRALRLDRWKKAEDTKLIDVQMLKQRTARYKELIDTGDVEGCMFHLRQELLRKHFGVCNPQLFSVAYAGTKACVERYIDTVCEAMTWAAFEHREGTGRGVVTPREKLAFFTETRHSFGRCALLLSGGAQLGMYHFGVIKALHQNGLLPRIMSGTSAGSIVCGIICVRSDDDLAEMWARDFDWDRHFNLNFFGDKDFGRFVQRRGEALYSPDVLAKALRENIGELTFLEAFNKTGRICNITVSGLPGTSKYPLLLNYLTSPHVLIWSAAQASAAVPGIFEAKELLAKDRHGDIVPYIFGGLKWRDGSMQNDLPMTRLTELFNVNFFIVSQVNPQAMALSGGGFGSSRGPVYRAAQFLRRELKQYLLSAAELGLGTAGGRVSPWLRPVGISAIGLLVQEYEGDITIFNGRGLQEMPHLLKNGSTEMLREYTRASEWETWWHIPQIENACKIEFVMDELIRELRLEARGTPEPPRGQLIRAISQDLQRLPSFQENPSLAHRRKASHAHLFASTQSLLD